MIDGGCLLGDAPWLKGDTAWQNDVPPAHQKADRLRYVQACFLRLIGTKPRERRR